MAGPAAEGAAGRDPGIGECFKLLEKLEGTERESVSQSLVSGWYKTFDCLLVLFFQMQFVHKAINDICEKVGLKYSYYFKLLSLADYNKLKNSITSTVRLLSRENLKKEQLAEKLKAMGASLEVSQLLAVCVWVRKDELHNHLVKESYNISQSRLNDFDWKLKVWNG